MLRTNFNLAAQQAYIKRKHNLKTCFYQKNIVSINNFYPKKFKIRNQVRNPSNGPVGPLVDPPIVNSTYLQQHETTRKADKKCN